MNCTQCHAGQVNPDTAGRVVVEAANYAAGVPQIIIVRVEHPEAVRRGFQLTARRASDPTKMAGAFTETADVWVRCDDGSPGGGAGNANVPRGTPGPCNGKLEFASHTTASTGGGVPGSGTWAVEWTPPKEDVGDVIFYAAGNAANNSSSPAGDRIYTTERRISSAGCPVGQRPTITSVSNAATRTDSIGLNSMISIFGTGFATTGTFRVASADDIAENKFPKEMACVTVEVAGERLPLHFVSPTQINLQAPTRTGSGPVKIEVYVNKGKSNEGKAEINVPMQVLSPAFFTFPGTGRGNIAARHTNGDCVADPAALTACDRAGLVVRVARPGDTISLYGTGFGLTEPVWSAGEIVSGQPRLREQVSVTIGGITVRAEDISYAGLSPGSISGLYQFNVRIPDTVADGNVAVTASIGGVSTQEGAIIPVRRQ